MREITEAATRGGRRKTNGVAICSVETPRFVQEHPTTREDLVTALIIYAPSPVVDNRAGVNFPSLIGLSLATYGKRAQVVQNSNEDVATGGKMTRGGSGFLKRVRETR